MTSSILNYFLLERLVISLLTLLPLSPVVRASTICDVCNKNQFDIPFYCPIKPDLPQCIIPNCPKICEIVGDDPSNLKDLPPPPPPRRPRPYPIYLPRVSKDYAKSPQGRSFNIERFKQALQQVLALGKLSDEDFFRYDNETCEFATPLLTRISPRSKYIEYRPHDFRHKINHIHGIVKKFGLVMAEFRHPKEWWSVEHSSIMQSVSGDSPKRIYAIGVKDMSKDDDLTAPPQFNYMSDKSSVTFAKLDPRFFGRSDEKCGILSHAVGPSMKQHLTQRFYSCNSNSGDSKRQTYALFMFPPGSLCYRRSEEECSIYLNEMDSSADKFHNLIQIGQTTKRFIYLYTEQRSWSESKAFCEGKGMRLLDLDPAWGDAQRVGDVIEHFLTEGKLNPVKMFWTSGRFDNQFSDGKFRWTTTNTYLETNYKASTSPAPFPFAFWDDMDVVPDEFAATPELLRRNSMVQPCVALALNPQAGGDRPKLNFKAWYCDFPMFCLCYKELNAPDNADSPDPPSTSRTKLPAKDSCEPLPKRTQKDSATPAEEKFEPFDSATCSSKSLTAKRLTPTSKFVDYQPLQKHHSVEEIKEHCKNFGLIPAEIRTREDWDSIAKSGIRGTTSKKENDLVDYFYVIGMDDSHEQGKISYVSDNSDLTFSMFTAGGNSNIGNRCTILKSLPTSTGTPSLVMHHANCSLGKRSTDKIAYGLCMFESNSDCYKGSSEEIAAAKDVKKFTTIIPLGATQNRSIFFNPIQRTWEDALKFCESAKLQLIDFDEKWQDTKQIMKLFTNKLEKNGGFFQHTPLWTSGKLEGLYPDKKGTWQTTQGPFHFPSDHYKWARLNNTKLGELREGTIENACVEATLESSRSTLKLRPDNCDIPKYFLAYRKTNRRVGDPPPMNTLGITLFESPDDDQEENRDPLLDAFNDLDFAIGDTNKDDEPEDPDEGEKLSNIKIDPDQPDNETNVEGKPRDQSLPPKDNNIFKK